MLIRVCNTVLDYSSHSEYDDGSVEVVTASGDTHLFVDEEADAIRRFFGPTNPLVYVVMPAVDFPVKTDDEVREMVNYGPVVTSDRHNSKVPDSIAVPFKTLVERQVEAYKSWDSDAGDVLAHHMQFLADRLKADWKPRDFVKAHSFAFPESAVLRKPR